MARPVGRCLVAMLLAIVSLCARAQALPPVELPLATDSTEQHLQAEVRRVEASHGTSARELVTPIRSLISFYSSRSRFAPLVALTERELAVYERGDGPDSIEAHRARLRHGAALLSIAQWERGEAVLDEAIESIRRASGPGSALEAEALRTRAIYFGQRGRYGRAVRDQQQVVDIRTRLLGTENMVVASDRATLADYIGRSGNGAASLPMFEESIATLEKLAGRQASVTLRARSRWAYVAGTFGQYEQARSIARENLVLTEGRPELRSIRREAMELLALDDSRSGNFQGSLERWLELLAFDRESAGGQQVSAATESNIGREYLQLGKPELAGPYLERAHAAMVRLYPEGSPNLARALVNLADLSQLKGDPDGASRWMDEAYAVASRLGDPLILAGMADRAAAHAWRRGSREEAIFFAKQAVFGLQAIRATIRQLGADRQRQFVEAYGRSYRRLAEYLIQEGRVAESQEVLAMLKDEELREYLRGDSAGRAGTGDVPFDAREARLNRRGADLADEASRLGRELADLQRKARLKLSEPEMRRREELQGQIASARRAFESFLADLHREFATASPERNREVGERQLGRLAAMRATLRELGEGVVLVHYLVAPVRVAIIVTTPTVQVARQSLVEEATLNRAIRDLRAALQRSDGKVLAPARKLHELLLAPIAGDLEQADARVLMLSLDAALRYVPFAALHDGERYVVERYDTAIYTEAARDKLKDRPGRDWRVAALGVTEGVGGFDPLPSVRDELEGIRGRVLPGDVWLDREFTADRLRDSLDKGFPLIHVASHFRFRPGTEADSFLLLGDGSRLSMLQVRERSFDFGGVDLVTLSACETGTGGGRDENGREVESFGALVQNLGAKGVIATLWPVADRSTGEFMQALYRNRQAAPGVTKAGALRKTQLAFLRGEAMADAEGSPGTSSGQDTARFRFAHPFYWAPFVLMGNWL